MTIQVLMPALSPTMTEGTLARWLKQEGESVESGDVIAEIETDKATMEVEAVDEGVMGKILVKEGTENVAVNTPIAVLLEEGESAAAISDTKDEAPTGGITTSESEQAIRDQESSNSDPHPINPVAGAQSSAPQPEGAIIENRDILYAQGQIIKPPLFDEGPFMAATEDQTVRVCAARCHGRRNAP